VVAVAVLAFTLLLAYLSAGFFAENMHSEPDVFVGVDVGFGNESDIYSITDAVKGYANLIILGSLDVTNDTTMLMRFCDYLYQKDFYFIVYAGFRAGIFPPSGPNASFVHIAEQRWSDRFLGLYIFDEPGGKQLDYSVTNPDKIVPAANNNTDAALHYVISVNGYLRLYEEFYYDASEVQLFTSDYGLYWYDYLCGYNVVFGEFAGNYSRQIPVALTREPLSR
jgi:hypothetical protein